MILNNKYRYGSARKLSNGVHSRWDKEGDPVLLEQDRNRIWEMNHQLDSDGVFKVQLELEDKKNINYIVWYVYNIL